MGSGAPPLRVKILSTFKLKKTQNQTKKQTQNNRKPNSKGTLTPDKNKTRNPFFLCLNFYGKSDPRGRRPCAYIFKAEPARGQVHGARAPSGRARWRQRPGGREGGGSGHVPSAPGQHRFSVADATEAVDGERAATMRVPEKYSTLPAEDRSVHIVNICAIEDLGYLPSEGTVSLSSGAVTGYLSAPCKDAGGSHSRTCDPETRCYPD